MTCTKEVLALNSCPDPPAWIYAVVAPGGILLTVGGIVVVVSALALLILGGVFVSGLALGDPDFELFKYIFWAGCAFIGGFAAIGLGWVLSVPILRMVGCAV